MKKVILPFLLILYQAVYSQEPIFTYYKIKDMGYLSIPDNLEVQSGQYKKYAESFQLNIGTITYESLENRIVFQQKGLNNGEGKETYARVIVKSYMGNSGDFPLLTARSSLSSQELAEFSTAFKDQTESVTGIKILTWYGVENFVLNGKYNGIKISYTRQVGDNPPVYVEIFQIFNNDRMHEITMSYRMQDSNNWIPLFKKIRESIVIIQQ